MNAPLVSVVMSVYNGERYLHEALDSILAQSLSGFEFLIVDDGSSDGSGAILREYAGRDTRIRVLSQENRGLTAALNRGCAEARGTYIARMDADDIAEPERFAAQAAYLADHPAVGAVGGQVRYINAAGTAWATSTVAVSDAEIRRNLLGGSPMYHPAVMMSRAAFEATGGYRELVVDAEDYDLWLRMADRFALANLPQIVLRYRVHANQVSVRKCRRQALGSLAARAAAVARWRGEPDPLDTLGRIDEASLALLGVAQNERRSGVVRALVCCIDYMVDAGEGIVALDKLEEAAVDLEWEGVDPWVEADYWLVRSKLHRSQGNQGSALVDFSRALRVRPQILGRPFKPFLRRLGLVDKQNGPPAETRPQAAVPAGPGIGRGFEH